MSEIGEPECNNNLFTITVPVIAGTVVIVLLAVFLPIVVVCLRKWCQRQDQKRKKEDEEMREQEKRQDQIRKKEDEVMKEIHENRDKLEYCATCLELLKIIRTKVDGEDESSIEEDREKIELSKAAAQIYQLSQNRSTQE